jgi:hypothetical protein
MKLKLCFLWLLTIFVATTTSAQLRENSEQKKIDFTDLTTEPQQYDGCIYVVNEKHYVAESIDSFFAMLKIDPKKDVENTDVLSVSNPFGKDKIDSIKEQLPEKNRDFKAVIIFHLRKQ